MLNYRLPETAISLIELFQKLNISFTLDTNESCCGYYIWNCGDHTSSNTYIEQNVKYLQNYDEIICACAGCYTFFKSNYPTTLTFTHAVEKIAQILPEYLDSAENKKINLLKEENSKKDILFHDSCHLSRPWGIIEPPRKILTQLGYKITEFSHSKENNLCCGADGGMRFINKELAIQIGNERIKEARSLSDSLFTLCPFCIFNFKDACKLEIESSSSLEIKDLYKEINDNLNNLQ